MRILFLHGWQSTPGGLKPTYLKDHGHEVLNPPLPEDDFDGAVRIAQDAYDRGGADVVVGSSRGGAVAMNIDSGDTPLVLLCPAWKTWGTATTVKPRTVILHSKADEVVPFADSEELVRNSGLPSQSLIEVGAEHRLADAESLARMLGAVEWKAVREAMERRAALEAIASVGGTRRALGWQTPSKGSSLGQSTAMRPERSSQVYSFSWIGGHWRGKHEGSAEGRLARALVPGAPEFSPNLCWPEVSTPPTGDCQVICIASSSSSSESSSSAPG